MGKGLHYLPLPAVVHSFGPVTLLPGAVPDLKLSPPHPPPPPGRPAGRQQPGKAVAKHCWLQWRVLPFPHLPPSHAYLPAPWLGWQGKRPVLLQRQLQAGWALGGTPFSLPKSLLCWFTSWPCWGYLGRGLACGQAQLPLSGSGDNFVLNDVVPPDFPTDLCKRFLLLVRARKWSCRPH